jgi:hypothetical protein
MLAFGFLHPWLALAAAPIGAAVVLVHLLRPYRHRPVRWAAMQFLQAAVAESRRRLRFERWLLLLLRTTLLVLLALMVARPLRHAVGPLLAARNDAALLVIVDNGLAMQAPSTLPPRTLMEQAIPGAAAIIHARPGTVAVLPALGDANPQWFARADLAESALEQLAATAGRANWPAVLAQAQRALPESGVSAARRTVLLLTTLTRGNWPDPDALAQSIADLLAAAGRVILVDAQPADRNNVAITDLAVESAFAGQDLPARAIANVTHYGTKPAAGLTIVWSVDGRQIRQDDVGRIPASTSRRLGADLPAFGGGPHSVEVHLVGPADALKSDDQRWAGLAVPHGFRFLVVEPDTKAPPADRASLFVTAALQSAASQSSIPVRIEQVAPDQLGPALFDPADAVLLCDVGGLTDADWRRLAEQVEQGCGLIVWLGPRSTSLRYAGPTARELLAGLPLDVDTAPEGRDWSVRLPEPVRPAFLDLGQGPAAGGDSALGSIRTLMTVQPAAESAVLATAASGRPVALLRRIGRAASILVTTSPDLAWNNTPSRPSFPAFVLGLLREALADRGQPLHVTCGRPIRMPIPGVASGDIGRWLKPDGTAEAARMYLETGRLEAVLPAAAMPGAYQLETGDAGRIVFANADPQAGDLAPLPDAQRRRLLQAGVSIVDAGDIASTLAAGAADDWTGLLAYVLLALLLAELALTGWFTRARQA